MKRPSMKYVVILGPILLALGAGLWFAKILTASPYLAVGLPFFAGPVCRRRPRCRGYSFVAAEESAHRVNGSGTSPCLASASC